MRATTMHEICFNLFLLKTKVFTVHLQINGVKCILPMIFPVFHSELRSNIRLVIIWTRKWSKHFVVVEMLENCFTFLVQSPGTFFDFRIFILLCDWNVLVKSSQNNFLKQNLETIFWLYFILKWSEVIGFIHGAIFWKGNWQQSMKMAALFCWSIITVQFKPNFNEIFYPNPKKTIALSVI